MRDATDPALRALLDSARESEAIRSRSGFDALRRHAAEDATVAGLLANLRDLKMTVTISTSSGSAHRGRVINVNSAGVVLQITPQRRSLIRLCVISTIRTADRCDLAGDGDKAKVVSWPTLVASFLDEADVVTITYQGVFISGQLVSISREVLALRPPNGFTTYAVVDSIDEVSLSEPGSIRHD